ncbi:hypothetical protein BGW36DRAFT_390909 [Talaromyces proteolyticus]|uniref:Uncharacterized protein n=1 Tax=Talaromyces proteolyticus TaxID=1131652 RepID=A0AAD4KIR9_9EURO|nr:uncharacterized protein BGW36DRAFT_390909 [Talaromyces proteolyticus]KAH8689465.1 hypothetical protein BGW36DRAFT_390909 [Talaromyces proteolyticus]
MGSKEDRKTQPEPVHRNPPNPPSTPVEPATRRAAYTRAAATTTKARRTTEDAEVASSFASSVKPRRAWSFRDWDSQITLTQIVPKAEPVDADAGLLEFDDNGRDRSKKGDIEVIDLVEDSDDGDDDTEYNPSSNRRTSTTKKYKRVHLPDSIPSTRFKSRRSVGFDSSAKKSTGLKGRIGKNQQKGKDGNKTLTQMDFVRRYIPLPESDDDLQSYDEPAAIPGNGYSEDIKDNMGKREEEEEDGPTPGKKRRLNENSAAVSPHSTKHSPSQTTNRASPPANINPTTPQKLRMFEIPSSQTPETPRQLASPELHHVPRFPLEALSSNPSNLSLDKSENKPCKTQSPLSPELDPPIPDTSENNIGESIKRHDGKPLDDAVDAALDTSVPRIDETDPSHPPQSSFRKTVVYETDADTDYGEFDEDNLPQASSPADDHTPKGSKKDILEEDRSIPNSDDSDDLPPPVPNSGTDLEINQNIFSDTALPSDASLYYRRPALYTQYPTEPVPILNTQKMAELFPTQEGTGTRTSTFKESSAGKEFLTPLKNQHSDIICPHTQTETQSDEVDKSTQMVPESSPVARNQEIRSRDEAMPPPQESVVLVESSQLVDKINRQNSDADMGPAFRKLLSAGDFLTDSVMESIPPPPWALSQDSVGEPYPEDNSHRK